MSTGLLPMDQLSRTWPTPAPVSQTFGSLRASVGERADLLASVYSAFGLAPPGDDSVVADDEESIIRRFIDTWALVDEGPEAVIRAARIAGEGVRRIQEADPRPVRRVRRLAAAADAARTLGRGGQSSIDRDDRRDG